MQPLALATLLLALAPPAPGKSLEQTLKTQCLLHAADPKNPWALAHGITGVGKSHVASDGRLASKVIVGDFLMKGTDPAANPFSFPRYAADGTPVEPHTNLQVKTLVLAGVPLQTRFDSQVGAVTLEALVEGARRGFRHVPQSEAYWQDVGWTLDALGAGLKPGKATFVNGAGETIDFDQVMDDALAYLERAQADLAAGMDAGQPQVDKRRQGIYAHSCGGLHLFQAVAAWARFPAVKKRWGKRLDRQINVLFYRLDSETRQYQAALRQAPQYRLQFLVQQLKFYGHFLENTGRLRRELAWKPSAPQRQAVNKARALLDQAVKDLNALQAFESLAALKTSQPQIALDLIGDACHAANGLRLWQ